VCARPRLDRLRRSSQVAQEHQVINISAGRYTSTRLSRGQVVPEEDQFVKARIAQAATSGCACAAASDSGVSARLRQGSQLAHRGDPTIAHPSPSLRPLKLHCRCLRSLSCGPESARAGSAARSQSCVERARGGVPGIRRFDYQEIALWPDCRNLPGSVGSVGSPE